MKFAGGDGSMLRVKVSEFAFVVQVENAFLSGLGFPHYSRALTSYLWT